VNLTDANDDEFFDLDDDRWENFRGVGEDEKDDQIYEVESEAIPVLTVEFVSKIKSWRQTRQNSRVRGAGTSLSTYKRTKESQRHGNNREKLQEY
jgi:hypothetical protein